MLGAFRRSAVSHALRSCPRTLSARSSPQRLQFLYSSISGPSSTSKSLFHSGQFRFSAQVNAVAENSSQNVSVEELPTRFAELGERNILPRNLVENLTKHMKLETMTEVQRRTILESVKGGDMLAQAKTGTGKTVAFLIPVVEKLLGDRSLLKTSYRNGRKIAPIDIRAIVISPTRELAEQIAVEAKRLVARTGLQVQVAVGGTMKRAALHQLQREGCHILVATPGRLKDLLTDPTSGVRAPKLNTFVLDEADRLLDEGFAPELMEIQHRLPDPAEVDRQTLMFSATVAPEVMGMVRSTMKRDFRFVKCVRDDEVPTHMSVPQKAVILQGLENAMPTLLELVKKSYDPRSTFKAIVYFGSTRETNTAFEAFDQLLAQRTRVANWFRKCQSGILFSTDVTARGMDFPNVTHVIQIGVPKTREDYIHRLGRTARAGKTGQGWIFIHEQQMGTLRKLLRDIPVEVDRETLTIPSLKLTEESPSTTPEATETLLQMKSGFAQVSRATKSETCLAQLSNLVGSFRNRSLLREAITNLAIHGYGLRDAPHIPSSMAEKAGLDRESGFSIRNYKPSQRHRQDSAQGHNNYGDRRRSFNDRRPIRNNDFYPNRRAARSSGRQGSGARERHGAPSAERFDKWLDNRKDEWA
ncbi:ATP-dependent RNA helicase helA [Aspergillus nidulans FGSC A4]|uniref:ATP-dependent RNA helicase n=1 Tax=Emericella nidulans (strain FGSC A4 / ATCC 38163 / CBS 112.46 / NRRL 194 / M139) TaxID=227321 RepID=C8VUS9_EMENI|nr:ATP-dependent RNA helicase helA [Aspergillus nidulans FGSC A4]CBF88575.1 TPA: DEAD box RNA helicase HelA, putative (AFU_orthologue; AFUA_1G15620) [Aspergillus nidulans FGSC A4]